MEDKDLVALLDDRFGTLRQYMDGRFEQIDGRFEQIDGRFEQIDGRFERVEGRLDRVESEIHEAHTEIEYMRDRITILAEGITTVDQKLDRFREETAENFTDVRGEMRYAFTHLEKRISALERRRR